MIQKYPILGVLGPRQSGKTTLVRASFPDFAYVSLEAPDVREYARNDPRGFLETYKQPAIFDEIQRAPELFSYLQERVDALGGVGRYVLTGSQNFILNEKISQTLAGRIYLVNLPTFTYEELKSSGVNLSDWSEYAFTGSYPRVWDKHLRPGEWYPSYIQTYLERDARDLKHLTDLRDFETFLKICAGRLGQTLVLSSLAGELGVSHNTVKSWLSVLEASYLVYILKPYFGNFNKRLTKSPKLYFLDTGLAVNLLQINDLRQIESHPLKGNIFENLVISEMVKTAINQDFSGHDYFLRDKTGHEVDYVLEKGQSLTMVEAKAAKTFNEEQLKGLEYWKRVVGRRFGQAYLVYAGDSQWESNGTQILNWGSLADVIRSGSA